jgi:hypothetical protein
MIRKFIRWWFQPMRRDPIQTEAHARHAVIMFCANCNRPRGVDRFLRCINCGSAATDYRRA